MEVKKLLGWHGYLVTSQGDIIGPRGKALCGYKDKNGYHCVALGPRGKSTGVKVHRAVVSTFIGPIPEGMHVNHKNGVKDDNRVENLEIFTPAENVLHGYRVLGRKGRNTNPSKGEAHHHSRFTETNIREIRKLYAAGSMQKDIAKKFGTSQAAVSGIVRRIAWRHIV